MSKMCYVFISLAVVYSMFWNRFKIGTAFGLPLWAPPLSRHIILPVRKAISNRNG